MENSEDENKDVESFEDENKDVEDLDAPANSVHSPKESVEEEKDDVLLEERKSLDVCEEKHELVDESEEEEEEGYIHEVGGTRSLDSRNMNDTYHPIEKYPVADDESDSDSELPSSTLNDAEEESGSDSESINRTTYNSEEMHVNPCILAPNATNQMDEKQEKEIGLHTGCTTCELIIQEVGSDLDFDKSKKISQTSREVTIKEVGSDSDCERPIKMVHGTKRVGTSGKEGSLNPKSRSQRRTTETAEKKNLDGTIHILEEAPLVTTLEGCVVEKNIYLDCEHQYSKKQPIEKLEKSSDSDFENPSYMSPTTKEVIIEEKEIRLTSESLNEVNPTIEAIEDKRVDPVFDGSETPEVEARSHTCSSSQSSDLHLDSAKYWPGKAASLGKIVKMKGAVVVTHVIRRLSGGKEYELSEQELKNVDWERPEEPSMKGRIILYTRLGCQESKKIRAFMKQRNLRIIEINVDVYPGRKLELEKNTGSSAVPKVYLNDLLVGGLTELEAMAGSGKLDQKINDLINEEPSLNAPMPPFSGEDDVSCNGKIDELASIVKKMKESVVISDRFYKMRRFTRCFLGSDAVNFLLQEQCIERDEAIDFGRKLVNKLFFHHVTDENIFEDGNHLYRFLEHDPAISTNSFNMIMGMIELEPKRITDLASRLRFLSFAIFEAYVSEDGRHVDYRSINDCEEFKRYLRIIEELQRVELDSISREEKLAFFINLHNMMAIHAMLTWGHPSGALDRKRFFGEFKYVVGGCPYSLSAIQNGILRGNQRPPYNITKPFGQKDKRFKVALPYAEPLIHFALVCGTRSGPPLRCYSPGNIDLELMENAREFLRNGGLLVDAETKTASASSIVRWYSGDFGKNEAEVMMHLSNYLEPSKSQDLLDLLAENHLRVTYQPYDWGSNY